MRFVALTAGADMGKRFLHGLAFGAGFGIAFVAIWFVAIVFVAPAIFTSRIESELGPNEVRTAPDVTLRTDQDTQVRTAPVLIEHDRYLGSSGIYSGEFSPGRNAVLSAGPGQIAGAAYGNGQPVSGLRLRLALNGSVMSQWATTGGEGRYAVAVPYGTYRIDGFELDRRTADKVLPGKIADPENAHSSGRFEVSAGAPGRGLDFRFVDPVVLDMEKKRFSGDEDVILRWKPYPGASGYSVQIYEKTDPFSYRRNAEVFPWSERPSVTDPFMNLKDHGVDLKPGHYYVVLVCALGADRRILSQTADTFTGFDFKVVE